MPKKCLEPHSWIKMNRTRSARPCTSGIADSSLRVNGSRSIPNSFSPAELLEHVDVCQVGLCDGRHA